MSQDKKGEVVSLSGTPIHHYDAPDAWQPAQGEVCLEEISAHITTHLGPVASVFHELASDTVHIDVHVVLPTEDFPYARLVTSGMSDLPMSVPNAEVPRHLELLVTLPGDWKLDQASFDDERWYWPVRLIKQLARFPHKYQTWLGWGHSMPNGDPPEPYAPDTELCGVVLLPSVTVPDAFDTLRIDADKEIHFLAVVPVYKEEMELKLRKGSNALIERLGEHDLNDIIDPTRVNVARKRFGIF
jgi:hypothetical protein